MKDDKTYSGLTDEDLAGIAGGEKVFLQRLDSPENRAAYIQMGYDVLKDIKTGKYFLIKRK